MPAAGNPKTSAPAAAPNFLSFTAHCPPATADSSTAHRLLPAAYCPATTPLSVIFDTPTFSSGRAIVAGNVTDS